MTSIDLVLLGLKNLWRRRLRTVLTVVGVLVGTVSVMIMLSLSIGMDKGIQNQTQQLGSLNVISVELPQVMVPGKEVQIDEDALAQFEQIPHVEAVSPVRMARLRIVTGKHAANVLVMGIQAEKLTQLDFDVSEGEMLSTSGVQLLVGYRVPMSFFEMGSGGTAAPPQPGAQLIDLLGREVGLSMDLLYGERSSSGTVAMGRLSQATVVGILENVNYGNVAIMDLGQLERLIKSHERLQQEEHRIERHKGKTYDSALVKVPSVEAGQEVEEAIRAMGFQTYSMANVLERLQESTAGLRSILSIIGAVALLVSALGITNTMIMSVYERTREIGIMKVIGASLADIRRLFLFEATMIGLIGGLVGVAASYGVSHFLNTAGVRVLPFFTTMPAGTVSVIPWWLPPFALLFSVAIGLVSGFYPAMRAMKLSVIDALRNE